MMAAHYIYLLPLYLISIFVHSILSDSARDTRCYKFNFYLSLYLEKQGFHREMHYEIEYPAQLHDLYDDGRPNGWDVVIKHEMPGGLFTNPDEINDLKAFRVINATVMGYVNVEMQASFHTGSLGGTLLIYGTIENLKAKLWAPVHARYHPPQPDGGFTIVNIEPGTLFMRSKSQATVPCGRKVSLPCNANTKKLCDWWDIPYILLTDTKEWPVPVGNLSHYPFIFGVTLFITMAGCLYITSSVFSKVQKEHRARKWK